MAVLHFAHCIDELSDVIHRSQGSSSLVIPYPLNVELMEQIISYGLFDQDGVLVVLTNIDSTEKSLQHLQNEDDMMPVFNHLMIPLKITSNMYSTLYGPYSLVSHSAGWFGWRFINSKIVWRIHLLIITL